MEARILSLTAIQKALIDSDDDISEDFTQVDNLQMLMDKYRIELKLERLSMAKVNTPPPHLWSISFEQLLEIRCLAAEKFGDSFQSKTMHDINSEIVKPLCARVNNSYALYLNPNGLPCHTFITHCWDEPFVDFVDSIEKVYQTHVDKPNLWICTFALHQETSAIQEELDTPLEESPFVRALMAAREFVVVRNQTTDLYSRIWCVCELMYAEKYGLVPDKTRVTGPDTFSHVKTSCLHAKATSLDDHEKILKVLLFEFGRKIVDDCIQKFRNHDTPQH